MQEKRRNKHALDDLVQKIYFNFDRTSGLVQFREMSLRPYQLENKAKIYSAWEAEFKNVLYVMATGLGKTRMFCAIAMEQALILKKPTAISVHRKELVSQISLTLAEQNIPHNIIAPRPVIKGIVAEQRRQFGKQFYKFDAMITVLSVDTLNSRIMKHEAWAKSIKLWICDEAMHLLKENKWGRAMRYFPNAQGLGVTATPERLDKRGLGSHVDGMFDTMVIGPDSRWGIQNGFLCNYKIAIPESDYALHLKIANGDSDYSKEAMTVASQKSHIVGDVVKNYKKLAFGKQAIVFASDIGAAERMEKEFLDAKISAKLLTGLTEDVQRLNAMYEYRQKKIQVLINVDLFDEGLDVPGIECVIMARPTMSLAKYMQMVGRGLRPAKEKPFLILIDHVGNVKTHGLPDSRRQWSLDRVTKRKRNLNLVRLCENYATCGAPFDRILTECPYCGTAVTRGTRDGGSGRVSPPMVDGDLVLLDPETLRELEAHTVLESPADIAQRITRAHGEGAGRRAMQNQIERIQTQDALIKTIAIWAGKMQAYGYTNRQINKSFFLEYDITITEILALPKADMLKWIDELEGKRVT